MEGLIHAPEFQRLKNIKMVNIDSPSFAGLSDVSRYSHTLGVLYLALQSPLVSFNHEDFRALLAALVFHDAGTPPFGHLIEYQLGSRFGFDHEKILPAYLKGTHHPDGSSHQASGSGTLRYADECRRANIDLEIVTAILSRKHPLSGLIFGSLDFDNLDNVLRMSTFLGLGPDRSPFLRIARDLSVAGDGIAVLPQTSAADVMSWMDARRRSYNELVFDEIAVARQAVMSEAVSLCVADGVLCAHDWDWSERDLLSRLCEQPQAKRILRKYYFDRPPRRVFHLQLNAAELGSAGVNAQNVRQNAQELLAQSFPSKTKTFTYVFQDKGTFEKALRFRDPFSGEIWHIGSKSESIVADGFVGSDRGRSIPLDITRRHLLAKPSPQL